MNTPIASAIIKRVATNSVGGGLTLQSRIDREGLEIADEAADKWERQTERLFRIWAESKNCDMSRTMNFYQLQNLAFVSPLLSGDVFFMNPWKAVKGSPFETRIKLIESDLCSNKDLAADNSITAGGITVDEDGAPIIYWFSNRYPTTTDTIDTDFIKWLGIPAYDAASGRQNVYHIFNKERPNQRRGMPFLSAVFVQLKQMSRLSDAKLMQNLIQSFFTVFVKDAVGQAGLAPNYSSSNTVISEEDPDKDFHYELGNASVIELDDKKDISVADPRRTDTGFKDFFESLVKQIGASCEVPFEQLLLHFSASYSASRAAIVEGYKFYKKQRASFALEFCQPCYENWLYEMVYKGMIDAPGFLDDPIKRALWSKSKWCGSGMGQIDPLKETNAAIKRIDANLSNHEEEYGTMTGGDWESAFNRRVREFKLIKASGVAPQPDAKTPSKMPIAENDDDEDTDSEDDNG